MIKQEVTLFDVLNNRLDVSFYLSRFNFTSKSFPTYCLSKLVWVNPTVKYEHLSENDVISFVPMEIVDEKDGKISEQRTTTIARTKGFTKFMENDLIWAKITPCMQNGKSAIARNLVNGYGCGSTEFYVLRPKTDNVLIEYIHFILRDKRVLESAKNSFAGSAGQQRVSSNYLRSIQIPLPPKEIQQQIVDLHKRAMEEKQAKEQEAAALLASIDNYLLKELGIELPEDVGNERYFEVNIQNLIGRRLDVSSYRSKFDFASKIFSSFCLSELLLVNPSVKYEKLSSNDIISFVPMEVVDEYNGIIAEQRTTTVSETKGFTKFKENDLIWAKITPCMQNGKSALARNLVNGYGCGSTEFYVLRPKTGNVLIEYVYFIMRDKRLLESAKNSFGGSAGQQRVSSAYLKSIQIPLPPIDIQQKIVERIQAIQSKAKQLQEEAKEVLEKTKQMIEKRMV